ncbi:chemotaxis response regulator protein-glutamate methylesterase [Alteromonas oceani]|uniref:Protein-glutamate methylesterase/protein-glutamine glutaminase n=1 Tax=Alteromonas oceani TaxID=2071609 RepID=A0ABV7JVH4_9ALTE|nr:chemotaxis response regulator protein-glutamate methylesterase [Alteromonas oceani]
MNKVKVLIVDDSALVRQALKEVISSDPQLEVIATAADPFSAVEKMKQQKPDVITLDVEMPRMDGVTFLHKIMEQHPVPVVICSSLVGEGTQTHIKALEAGAVDIIVKPTLGTRKFLEESKVRICDAVKGAARARLKKLTKQGAVPAKKLNADSVIAPKSSSSMVETTEKVIVIGASTGGTEAIRVVLQTMPLGCPGIVIVQHMPEGFTRSFAKRLNGLCSIEVKEAQNGDAVLRGQALIAPGNKHTLLKRSGARYYVEVKDGPLVSRHRPSVDVLFRSTAKYAGRNAIATILTGMGDDGANGMVEMKEAGAWTCAQDEETCVVYGMPKEAYERGGTDLLLPLNNIGARLLRAV